MNELPADSSPELALLLALLRSALGHTAPVAAPTDIDWSRFLATVERHRLGAFLAQRAGAQLTASCPPEVGQKLQAAAASTAQRALIVMAQQLRLTRLFAAGGIEVLAVKGLVSAEQLYGGIGRRHVGDLDLLVRSEDVARADALLQTIPGLRRTRPDFPLTPRQLKEYVRVKPEFEYMLAPAALRVELLWRLEGLPAKEDVWTDAVECAPGGHRTRTLAPELNALYLFQHGARHAWFRLFWLVDIALLLQSADFDASQLIAHARRTGAERAVLQGAALAQRLFAFDLPPALVPQPSERAIIGSLVDEACRQITRTPVVNESVTEWFRQVIYRVRLQKNIRTKFAVLTPHLFSPLNWQTLPLPDRWFFIYYLTTPFLWLWRRLARSRVSA